MTTPIDPASTPLATPQMRKNRGISVIWTLPVLALVICLWLLYQSQRDAGIDITITFVNGNGLIAGKTQVFANGIPIGLVKELTPDLSGNQVRARVLMNKESKPHLVEDTLFWVVRPELSAARVAGLETILTGSYIGIRAGTSTSPRREFAGLDNMPAVASNAPGLHISLQAKELGSIQNGTGIYFKNIEIGSVQDYQLADEVTIALHIKPEFAHLVRQGSRFCNASGLSIDGKLTDLKIHVESLSSLLRGGIMMQTPEQLQDSPPAENGQVFHLYKDYEDANYGVPMTLQLASGADIIEGVTKVMYRGLEAGFVREVKINNDERRSVTATIMLDPRAELILKENTVFWLVKAAITPAGVSNLQNLLTGSHITFQPGDGAFCDHFTILEEPPPQEPLRPGTSFTLQASGAVPVRPGGPVYCQDIQVGEIVDVQLGADGKKVTVAVFLYEPHWRLVGDNTVFWLQQGVSVKAALSGVEVKTGPLAQVLFGGIAFTNLPHKEHRAPKNGHVFKLFPDYAAVIASHAELQPSGLHFRLLTDDPGSLSAGAPVLHKNIPIGKIERLSFAPGQQQVLIDCLISEEYRQLITAKSRCYRQNAVDVSGGLGGLKMQIGSMDALLHGGIVCLASDKAPPPGQPLPLFASQEAARHADEPEITLRFRRISGLKEGAALRYRGVLAGEVTAIRFSSELESILVTVRVQREVAPLLRRTTRFWLVEPEIALTRLRNTDALVASYLTFLPGSGPLSTEFTALEEPPQDLTPDQPGLPVILETAHLGSLEAGSPVYYRQVQVGAVTGYQLAPNYQKVLVFVRIEPPYIPLVRANTRFWNASGLRVSGGIFSGVSLATESLTSILRGGIALATPEGEEAGTPVAAGYHFPLHEQMEPQWLDWNPDIVLLQREYEKVEPARLRR